MRRWHRWTMTVFSVLLAYWVLSGLTMAIYDATDPTQVWAIQGGGPGARLTDDAIGAPPLPAPVIFSDGIGAALRAVVPMPVASVDLRMRGAAARLQLAEASGARATMRRFYATTGAPMSDLVADGGPGAAPPQRVWLRNTIKSWHRGNIAGLPGQFLGLLTGLGLIGLTITGVLLYLDLWKRRRASGRASLFWQSRDSLWRRLHRWSGIICAVFILNTAISGCILAWGEIQLQLYLQFHVLRPLYPMPSPLPAVSAAALPAGVTGMLQTSYQAALARHPGAAIASVTLVERGDGVPHGLVTLAGARPVTLAFNALTGAPVADWATGGVQRGAGYFADWHQVLKRIHRGDIVGAYSGRLIAMLTGLALLYLVVSSMVMYADLFGRRRAAGKPALFW